MDSGDAGAIGAAQYTSSPSAQPTARAMRDELVCMMVKRLHEPMAGERAAMADILAGLPSTVDRMCRADSRPAGLEPRFVVTQQQRPAKAKLVRCQR